MVKTNYLGLKNKNKAIYFHCQGVEVIFPKHHKIQSIRHFEEIYDITVNINSKRVQVCEMSALVRPYIRNINRVLSQKNTYEYHATCIQLQHDYFFFSNAIAKIQPFQDLSDLAATRFVNMLNLKDEHRHIVTGHKAIDLEEFRNFTSDDFKKYVRQTNIQHNYLELKRHADVFHNKNLIGHSVMMEFITSNYEY